ncbi:MAG: hypothetical protein VXZ05_07100 [Pseudomonadota bacterium]|nr:hypothetical protein [Pseudomonadota bacterium]
MMLIAAVLASFVLGGALTGFVLSRRWQSMVAEAKQNLEGMAEQYRVHEQENRELKQKNADLTYQMRSLQKDLNYERSRHTPDSESGAEDSNLQN